MRTTELRLGLAVAVLAAIVAAPHAGARPAASPAQAGFIDDPPDCAEPVPAAYSLYGVDDDGQEIVLDVHFVLDEVPPSDAQAMVEEGSRPYEGIGIRIDATYEHVSFAATGETSSGDPTIGPQEMIDATRDHLRGYRPHHADVVYAATTKELVDPGVFGGSVAGMADCIGGIRYPEAAFAVGEVDLAGNPPGWSNAIIAAHEIAHLLGAHHHYANCAEGDRGDLTTHGSPCTVMFNDTFFISLKFSTLEGAVVRGHALEYAAKTPAGPPPVAERSVEVERVRRWFGGAVAAETVAGCYQQVTVDVHRRQGRRWVSYATTETDVYGEFEVKVTEPGDVRAVVAPTEAHDGKSWRTCAEAISTTVRF